MTNAGAFPHQDDTVRHCATTDAEVFHDDATPTPPWPGSCARTARSHSRAAAGHAPTGSGGPGAARRLPSAPPDSRRPMARPRPPTGEPPLRHSGRLPQAHPRQGEAVHIVQGSRIRPSRRLHRALPAPHTAPGADHCRHLNPDAPATAHHDGPTDQDTEGDLPQARPTDRPRRASGLQRARRRPGRPNPGNGGRARGAGVAFPPWPPRGEECGDRRRGRTAGHRDLPPRPTPPPGQGSGMWPRRRGRAAGRWRN